MMLYNGDVGYNNKILHTSMSECNMVARSKSTKAFKLKSKLERSKSIDSTSFLTESVDSNTKKQASIHEIRDLYSALHDLVTTNVTTTCLPERHPRINSHGSSSSSSLNSTRSLQSPSPVNNKEYSKRIKDDFKHAELKSRRGMSVGTIDMVTNLVKRSPFPLRKISNDTDDVSDRKHRKTMRSKSEVSSKLKKIIIRDDSNNSNKKWKLNIFKKRRLKSSTDEEDEARSLSDDDNSPSEEEKTTQISDSFISKNINDIDKLVAALNLEESDTLLTSTETDDMGGCELDQLESWFSNAAAEAALCHSKQTSFDSDTSPFTTPVENGPTCNRKKSAAAALKRASTVKRGCSIEQNDKQRISKLSECNFLDRNHARSTPNLRGCLNNEQYFDCENNKDTQNVYETFTEYLFKQTKSYSPKQTVLDEDSPFKLEDGISRLPKSKVFYSPDDQHVSQSNEPYTDECETQFDISIALEYENGLQPSPRTIERIKQNKKNSGQELKNDSDENAKNCNFFSKEQFENSLQQKDLWYAESNQRLKNIRNSLHLDTLTQKEKRGILQSGDMFFHNGVH